MPHPTHHLFLSYSRKDNLPKVDGGEGWITAFHRRLQSQHLAYTGRELRVFFDTEEIDHGGDWKGRLGQGLRTSRLFLAFLSPNYMRSPNCRWEWEEYLRREHTQARGEDGIRTIFFDIVPGMPGVEAGSVQAIESELRADQEIARWLDMITEELSRRNAYLDPHATHSAAGGLHPKAAFDLRPWFSIGPHVLAELDAAERLEQLRQNPKLDTNNIVTLAERLQQMDQHITTRLDRCLLADFAPGNRSLGRSYPHFVGRHRELRQLHDSLVNDKIGIVTAVHGLGGQGKTALAIQYAHAYADFYAAGGRWVIPCEGVTSMAEAMMRLATQVELRFEVPPEYQDKDRPDVTVQFVLHLLEQLMRKNATDLLGKLRGDRDRMSRDEHLPEIEPRTLIILDNVDQPELLSAAQLALLPQAEWFELVVTTRLDPERFGIGKELRPIPVDSLPIEDAVALVRDFQPNQQFVDAEDEAGTRRLCEILGGFTLSVELAAAYLGEHPEVRPGDYCDLLLKNGLPTADEVAEEQSVASQIRHREKQLAVVADWTLARLDERARMVLEHASFLEPDSIMMDWLREIAGQRYPELRDIESQRTVAIETLKEIFLVQLGESGEGAVMAAVLDELENASNVIATLRKAMAGIPDEMKVQFEQILNDASAPALQRGKPNEWLEVWKQLRGLRLLTPWDEAGTTIQEGASRTHGMIPAVARIHRLIASHLQNKLKGGSSNNMLSAIIAKIFEKQEEFEHLWRHSARDHWMVRPFGDNALYLARKHRSSLELAMGCGVFGLAEMTLGSLARAEQLIHQFSSNLRGQFETDVTNEEVSGVYAASLITSGDFFLSRGQSGDMERALSFFEESHRIAWQIYEANPNTAHAADNLSVSFDRLGDFYLSRGQLGDAELAVWQFEESHRLRMHIYESNPCSFVAARNLGVSYQRLGDSYYARGGLTDSELSLIQYEESYRITKQNCDANPSSSLAARDHSVSCERLGNFYRARDLAGDTERSVTQFEESHRIRKQIYQATPNSVQAARDLSLSLNLLGDHYLARGQCGDAELALTYFEESLRIAQQQYEVNPDSALAARDLSVSLSQIGDFYLARCKSGDAERALTQFEGALEIAKRLYGLRPKSTQAAKDLSVFFERYGDGFLARGQSGDAENALTQFEESLKVALLLFETNPNSSKAAKDLLIFLERHSDLASSLNSAKRALELQVKALQLAMQIHQANPKSASAGQDAAESAYRTARKARAAGQKEIASKCLGGCFLVLHTLIQNGSELNPFMANLYEQLHATFGDLSNDDET